MKKLSFLAAIAALILASSFTHHAKKLGTVYGYRGISGSTVLLINLSGLTEGTEADWNCDPGTTCTVEVTGSVDDDENSSDPRFVKADESQISNPTEGEFDYHPQP